MQENIFCKQCGKPGATTENFCKYCGEQINSDSINSISDESTQIPQTIGKKYLKIKIVKNDGEKAGFFVNVVLREWVMALIGIFPAIGGIIQIVDILFIFRDDRKCIHDLIAGTVVISVTE